MMNEDNISGLIAIITGMIIFKVSTYFESFESFLSQYKVFVLIAVFFIYFNRKKIADKFNGRKKLK